MQNSGGVSLMMHVRGEKLLGRVGSRRVPSGPGRSGRVRSERTRASAGGPSLGAVNRARELRPGTGAGGQ